MNKAIASIALSLATTLTGSAQTKEILSLSGSEGKLYAELQKPVTGAEKLPLVIICHGFTANCNTELLTDIANDLQEQGIASLRFDFNGHGKSDGEFQNMTVLNEIEDLKDVISWALSQPCFVMTRSVAIPRERNMTLGTSRETMSSYPAEDLSSDVNMSRQP